MPDLDIFSQIFSFSTLVYCIAIFCLVWIQRRTVEVFFPKVITENWWRELIVPSWPIVLGGSLASLITSYPYPDIFKNAWTSRAAFGIFCGLFSSYVYRMLKKNVTDKIGITTPTGQAPADPADQI